MFSNWLHNGIKVFKDIYDVASKKFYPFSRLQEIYNLPQGDFLKYLTLIHRKPHSWKTNIKNENTNTPNPHTILRQLMNTKHTNKYVYNLLQKKENIQIRNQRRNGLNSSMMETLTGKQFTHLPFGQQKT